MSDETDEEERIAIGDFKRSLKAFIAGALATGLPALAVSRTANRMHVLADEVRRSEALLRQVLDILPVGVWVADENGVITLTNSAALEIWGGARYVGKERYSEYKSWWADTGKPVKDNDRALTRAVKYGQTSIDEILNIETFDGKRKTILNSALPIKGEGNQITGAIVVNQDITEQKQVEAEIRESRERLDAIINNTSAAIYMKDREGRVLLGNSVLANVIGKPIEQILGHTDRDLFPPETAEQFMANDKKVFKTGNPLQVEETMWLADGIHTFLSVKFPLHDSSGIVYALCGISTDITELVELRRQVERSLDETQRDRERIAALEGVAEAGISTLGLQDLLQLLSRRIGEALHVAACTILMFDDKTNEFVVRATYNADQELGARLPANKGLVEKIYNERKTLYIADAKQSPLVAEMQLIKEHCGSIITTPIIVRDKIVGMICIEAGKIRDFDAEEIRLLETMAARAALAIDNSMLFDEAAKTRTALESALRRERVFSVSLQRALAPPKPAIGPEFDVAVEYMPAYAGQSIGGDFYDVFETHDGRTAVLIGDVSGKGVEAAALAAATRSTVRAFTYEYSCAGDAFTHANSVLYSQQAESESFVTTFLAIIDSKTGDICYASAGHPPSVILHPETGVEFLEYGDPPMGLVKTMQFRNLSCHLDPGDKITFYTDGVMEARRGVDMFGMEGIQRVLEQHARACPKDLTREILAAAKEWAGGWIHDDAALVVIERLS